MGDFLIVCATVVGIWCLILIAWHSITIADELRDIVSELRNLGRKGKQ